MEAEINNLNDNINTILQEEETATKLLQLHEKFLLQEYTKRLEDIWTFFCIYL